MSESDRKTFEVISIVVPVIMGLMFVSAVAFAIYNAVRIQRNQMDGVAYHAPPPVVNSADPTRGHGYSTQSAGYHSPGGYPPQPAAGYHHSVAMVPLPGGPQPAGYYQPQGFVTSATYSEGSSNPGYYQPQGATPVVPYPTATVVYAEPMDYRSTPSAPQPGERW
jgi:hypothetical protein